MSDIATLHNSRAAWVKGIAILRNSFVPLLLISLALSGYKLYLLEHNSRTLLGCTGCLANIAISYEIQFLLLIIALHILSSMLRPRLLGLLVRIAVVLALLITAIDLAVLNQFLVRFTFNELGKFIGEYEAIANHLKQNFASGSSMVLALTTVSIMLMLFIRYLYEAFSLPKKGNPLIFGMVTMAAAGTNFLERPDFHMIYLHQSVRAFFSSQSRTIAYSKAFIKALPPHNAAKDRCVQSLGARPDLILVIIESLSMYHSKYFSGLRNWTPELDKMAIEGRAFTNFHANGTNTAEGLVALMTGQPPIPKPNKENPFHQFAEATESVPKLLNKLGYQTSFLTTGNLRFLSMGDWLRNIGFTYVEGHDAHFYDGMPRFNFDAAPDQALYDRGLQYLDQSRDTPIFLTLDTVSTHHPYVDPQTGEHSAEKVFRYADEQLGRFVAALRARGFFNHGYMIVTSDHRAMMPLQVGEYTRFGDRAFSRIPLVILGLEGNQPVDEAFSQSDLLPSLTYWLGEGKHCNDQNQGIFLPAPLYQPECHYALRSYDLDRVVMNCGSENYAVHLNGDNTRYVEGHEGPPELLKQIHRLRIGSGF